MATCRVYYKADGMIVTKTRPYPQSKKKEETTQEWLDRVYARNVEKNPHLAGLSYVDMDEADLPPRKDANGTSVREKWRWTPSLGVHVDNSIETVFDRRKAVQDQINTELNKPAASVNVGLVLKLQRDLKAIQA